MSSVNNDLTSTTENTPVKMEHEESTSNRWADMCNDYDVPLVDTYNEQHATKEKTQETHVPTERREFGGSHKPDSNNYSNCFEVNVRNLNAEITQEDICKMFGGLKIKRINILKKKGKTTNAYVEFETFEDMNKSLLHSGNTISPKNKVEDGPISVIANKDKMKMYHSNQKQGKYKKVINRNSNNYGNMRNIGPNNMNAVMNNYNNSGNKAHNMYNNMAGSNIGGGVFNNDVNKNMKSPMGNNGSINSNVNSNANSSYSYNHNMKMNYMINQQNNQMYLNKQNINHLNDKPDGNTGSYNFKNANFHQGGPGSSSSFNHISNQNKHLNTEETNTAPVERKKLVLKKRTVPLNQKEYVVNPSIFGSAKPVDVDPEKILSEKEKEKEKEIEKNMDTEKDKMSAENMFDGNMGDKSTSDRNDVGAHKERSMPNVNNYTCDMGRDVKLSNSGGRNAFNFKKGNTAGSRNFLNNSNNSVNSGSNNNNNNNNPNPNANNAIDINSNTLNNNTSTINSYQNNMNKNNTMKKSYGMGKNSGTFGPRRVVNAGDNMVPRRTGNVNLTNPQANANFNNSVNGMIAMNQGRNLNQGQNHNFNQKPLMNRGYSNVENDNFNDRRNSSTGATPAAPTGASAVMPVNKPKKSINVDIIKNHICNNTPLHATEEPGKQGDTKRSGFANRTVTDDDFSTLRSSNNSKINKTSGSNISNNNNNNKNDNINNNNNSHTNNNNNSHTNNNNNNINNTNNNNNNDNFINSSAKINNMKNNNSNDGVGSSNTYSECDNSIHNNNNTNNVDKEKHAENKLSDLNLNEEKREVPVEAENKKEICNALNNTRKAEENTNDTSNKEVMAHKSQTEHTNENGVPVGSELKPATQEKQTDAERNNYYYKRGSSYSNAAANENVDPNAIENLYDCSLKYARNASTVTKTKKMTSVKPVKVIATEKKNEGKENGAETTKEEKNTNENDEVDAEKQGTEEKKEEKNVNEKNVETSEIENASDNYTYVTENSDSEVSSNADSKDKDITTTDLKSTLLQTKTKKKIKKNVMEDGEEHNNIGNTSNENNQASDVNRVIENGTTANSGVNVNNGDTNDIAVNNGNTGNNAANNATNNQPSQSAQNGKKAKIDILIKPNVKKGENVWEARTQLLVDQKESEDNDSATEKDKKARSDVSNSSSHHSRRSHPRSYKGRDRTRSRNHSRRREYSRRRDSLRRDGRRRHHRDRERERERDRERNRSERGDRDREKKDSRNDDGGREDRGNSYEYRKHRSYDIHGSNSRMGPRGAGNDRSMGNHYDRKKSGRYYNSGSGEKKNYDSRSYISDDKWKHKDSFESSKTYKDYYDKGYKNSHEKLSYKDSTEKSTNKENYDKEAGGNSGGKYATSSYSSSRHNKSYKHNNSHQKMNSYNSNYSSNYKSGSYYSKYSPKGSFYKDGKSSSKQIDKEKSQSKTDVPAIPKKAIVTPPKTSNVSLKKNRYQCLNDGEESDK